MSVKKVFVSGCYDLLHSGHVEFFKQASAFAAAHPEAIELKIRRK